MPNVLSSQILVNGPRFIVAKYTNISDGTAEVGVTKLDATNTGPFGIQRSGQMFYPGVRLAIASIWFSCINMAVRLQWHATTNVDIVTLAQSDNWTFMDERGGFGGLTPPVGVAGITGSIDFSTYTAVANSAYTVILKCTKNAGQD